MDSKNLMKKIIFYHLQDRGGNYVPKHKLGQLVRTADIRRSFNEGDTSKCSYKLNTITEIFYDKIPSYKIEYLPERYVKYLLGPTKITNEENNEVMRKLKLFRKK